MSKMTDQEFLKRLELLDEETLIFLTKYSVERRNFSKASTIVSATIASVAGVALAGASFFPNSSGMVVGIISTMVGCAVVWLNVVEKRKEDVRLIRKLLRESNADAANFDSKRKHELIELFLKAEGL